MATPFEDQVSQEAPPVRDAMGLMEWLTRTIININGALRAVIERVLSFKITGSFHVISGSAVDQIPTAIDAPMQVSFGSAIGTIDDPIQMDALGTITCNETDSYILELVLSVSRDGNPSYANLLLYGTLNDVGGNAPLLITVDKPGDKFPFVATFREGLKAGDYLKFYIVRDASGSDSGGLYTHTPSAAMVPDVPSAWIRITSSELSE